MPPATRTSRHLPLVTPHDDDAGRVPDQALLLGALSAWVVLVLLGVLLLLT